MTVSNHGSFDEMITTIHEFLIKSQIFQKVATLTPTMLVSEKREFNFTQLDVKKYKVFHLT